MEGFYFVITTVPGQCYSECSVDQCWSLNYLLLIYNEMSTEVKSKHLEMFIAMTSKSLVIFLPVHCIVFHKSTSPLWITKKKKRFLKSWFFITGFFHR